MKIQQHVYDMERKRKMDHQLRNARVTNKKRQRPKSKSNLNIIQHINHGKEEVSF